MNTMMRQTVEQLALLVTYYNGVTHHKIGPLVLIHLQLLHVHISIIPINVTTVSIHMHMLWACCAYQSYSTTRGMSDPTSNSTSIKQGM